MQRLGHREGSYQRGEHQVLGALGAAQEGDARKQKQRHRVGEHEDGLERARRVQAHVGEAPGEPRAQEHGEAGRAHPGHQEAAHHGEGVAEDHLVAVPGAGRPGRRARQPQGLERPRGDREGGIEAGGREHDPVPGAGAPGSSAVHGPLTAPPPRTHPTIL